MTLHDSDCVFCRIIRGELDSATIYEDESTLAFMNLHQSNEGHVLVVPRNHFEQICDLDEDTASALAISICKVAGRFDGFTRRKDFRSGSRMVLRRFRKCRMFTGIFSQDTRMMAFSWSIPGILPIEPVE